MNLRIAVDRAAHAADGNMNSSVEEHNRHRRDCVFPNRRSSPFRKTCAALTDAYQTIANIFVIRC